MLSRSWLVYILRCRDGTLYVGTTNDLEKRVQAHNAGRGAKYTRGRGPVTVVYRRRCRSAREARLLEPIVKRLDRGRRLLLIEGDPGVMKAVTAALRLRTRVHKKKRSARP